MTEPGDATTADAPGPWRVLRGAVPRLRRPPTAPTRRSTPAEHAARFEAVHDALVAVLADVDRT